MARIRTIKPELFISETLALVSLEAERTFTGLLTQADDKGRFKDSPAVLNGALWPCRPDHAVSDMKRDIDSLIEVGLLCRYDVAGKKYLHFPTWDEHQKISHPSTRNIMPSCPIHDDEDGFPLEIPFDGNSPKLSGNSPEGYGNTPQGKERKGKEGKGTSIGLRNGGVRGGETAQQRSATPPAAGASAPGDDDKRKPPTSPKVQAAPTASPLPDTRNTSKANTNRTADNNEEEGDMGVYDNPVEPFEDLRDKGAVTRHKKKVGKNGVEPQYVADVDRVIEHFTAARKAVGTKMRVTDAWYTNTQALLRGTGAADPFTADQLCDLIDFGIHHPFWHAHLTDPSGLRKHGPKLFGSDDYISWSLANKRPEANRPRSTTIKPTPNPPKGQILADRKHTAEEYRGGFE